MMNRRGFFSSVAAAFSAPQEPSPKPAAPLKTELGGAFCGGCGFAFSVHGHFTEERFLTCENPHCPQYHVPVSIPVIAAMRADPQLVQRVAVKEKQEAERLAAYLRA